MNNLKNSPHSEVIKPASLSGLSWILYILFTFLVIFLLFAYFSKIDISVKAPVKIVKYNNYGFKFQTIQSDFSGKITKLNVKDGDKVNEGDILAEVISEDVYDNLSENQSIISKIDSLKISLKLEETLKDKKIDEINNKFANQKDTQSRELNQQISTINELNQEKLRLKDLIDNKLPNKYNNQKKLSDETINYLQNRRDSIKDAYEKGIKTGEELKDIENKLSLEVINKEKIATDFDNEISNYKNDLLKIDDQIKRADIQVDLIKSRNPKSEIEKNIAVINSEFEKQKLQINDEISNLTFKLNQSKNNPKFQSTKYTQVVKENNILKVYIKSPVRGFIDSLKILSSGEFVDKGKVLMNIYPESATLVAEANIPAKDIGLLKELMETKIKFDSFPYQDYGFVEGLVWKISKDSINDSKDGDIYKLLARFDQSYLSKNADPKLFENMDKNNSQVLEISNKRIVLKQGLTGTIEIVKEQKSILDLVIKPFKDLANN